MKIASARRLAGAGLAGALGAAMLAASIVPADAISRVRSDQNSCAAVQAVVKREGAVILQHASKRVPNYLLYDRYVANRNFCALGEVLERETVPAADTASCRVYVCKRYEPRFNDERFIFGH
jgi:hypothetical protein